MKRMKQFLSLVAVCIFSLSAWAQETVAVNTGDLISPEVKNQTVTFRLLAPEAREVWVETDFFDLKSATPFPKCYLHKEKWTFDS